MKKDISNLLEELKAEKYSICLGKDLEPEIKTPTGIFLLDYLLGGGIGLKHRIEFFGKEGCGKTLLSLLIIREFQKRGKNCIFVDAERSFDKEWAEILGVDVNNLIILYPESLEQAGDLLYRLVTKKIDLIIIDSIVSLIPKAEIERDTDEPTIALNAKINALICKKIYSAYADSNTSIIFINQMREKVGVMYGNPNTTGGGKAPLHLYNTRVEFKVGKPIITKVENEKGKEEEVRVGHEIQLHCIKNKKGKSFRTGIVDFYYDGYVDNKKSLFYNAIKFGVIATAGGGNYTYKDIKGKGIPDLFAKLDEKMWKEIEAEIWKNVK